jgi:hypothetical protein
MSLLTIRGISPFCDEILLSNICLLFLNVYFLLQKSMTNYGVSDNYVYLCIGN